MKITELKGIGEKYAQLLGRLSVYTVEDLVLLLAHCRQIMRILML